MNALIPLLALAAPQSKLPSLDPVPFTDVTIQDRFWTPRQRTNKTATVRQCLAQLEKAGNLIDMELAAQGKHDGFKGLLFTDSDLYKVLEGVAYTLATDPDPAIEKRFDEIVGMIAKAQQPDGYLDTWFQVTRPQDKFKNLRDWHELYCGGHMIEGAVAYFQATGKRNFLDIALKWANLVNQKFGPGGAPGYGGHPELELALVKLWRVTKDAKWLTLADRLVTLRGTHYFAKEHSTPEADYDGTYWLDDVPIRDHKEIKGHAVRAAYLLSGAADVAEQSGDPGLIKMLQRVWRNATEKRIFVTGGIGPSGSNEGFTVDYDLPNGTAYQETCASIAMALWGRRMAGLFGDAKYADAVETALYNGVLSGVSWDGTRFFYVNPLASQGSHRRSEWFSCACCPPNVLRTIASLGDYAYCKGGDSLYANLYVGGSVKTALKSGAFEAQVKTDYPWSGRVEYSVARTSGASLHLRVPGWCHKADLTLNGKPYATSPSAGYLVVKVKKGDSVVLNMDMPAEQIEAHPNVKDDRGRVCVRRGPLVYCAEGVDSSNEAVDAAILPRGAALKPVWRTDLFGGLMAVEASALQAAPQSWDRSLYRAATSDRPLKLTLIPYAYWANRKASRMEVWLPTSPPPAKVLGLEGRAKVTTSYQNWNSNKAGVNDGVLAEKSGDQPAVLCHFWDHLGGSEWVQYTWDKPVRVSGVKVFWFDDRGRGACRLPASWSLEAEVNGKWQAVELSKNTIALDQWTIAEFKPLTVSALRLQLKQAEGFASGVHEWQVIESED